ncbi:MAG TPA: hypothetical protein VD905_06865 [Flavobacteriales bacterium]|nr:hypothetical protein [Flavobacteriales bacterium]
MLWFVFRAQCSINSIIKKITAASWSASGKCWYFKADVGKLMQLVK